MYLFGKRIHPVEVVLAGIILAVLLLLAVLRPFSTPKEDNNVEDFEEATSEQVQSSEPDEHIDFQSTVPVEIPTGTVIDEVIGIERASIDESSYGALEDTLLDAMGLEAQDISEGRLNYKDAPTSLTLSDAPLSENIFYIHDNETEIDYAVFGDSEEGYSVVPITDDAAFETPSVTPREVKEADESGSATSESLAEQNRWDARSNFSQSDFNIDDAAPISEGIELPEGLSEAMAQAIDIGVGAFMSQDGVEGITRDSILVEKSSIKATDNGFVSCKLLINAENVRYVLMCIYDTNLDGVYLDYYDNETPTSSAVEADNQEEEGVSNDNME